MNSSHATTSNAFLDEDDQNAVIAMAHSIASGLQLPEVLEAMENNPDCNVSRHIRSIGVDSITNVNSVLASVGAVTPDHATDDSEYVISQPMVSAVAIMHVTTALVFREKIDMIKVELSSYSRLLALSVVCNIILVAASWLK